jgi:hypothetical protein
MGRVNRPLNAATEVTALGSTNFVNSFTRAGSANYFDSTGTLQTAGTNVLRTNYNTFQNMNYLVNPRFEGSAPLVDPTAYAFSSVAGVSKTNISTGFDATLGLPFVDIRYAGTPTVDGNITLFLSTTGTNPPATQGQTLTISAYVAIVAGTQPYINVTGVERDGAGAFVQGASTMVFAVGSTLRRYTYTYTMLGAATAGLQPTINIPVLNGVPVSFTIRLAGPQAEVGSTASTGVALPPAGTPGISALFTIPRAQIEGSKTNGIRNPRAEGSTVGVIGSGGVAPTNWTISGGTGVAMSVVGTGTEAGIPYIDVRCVGTAGAAIFPAVFFEANNSIAAVSTDRRTISAFLRLVSGTWANVSAIGLGGWEYSATPTFLASNTGTNSFPTGALLSTQRMSYQPTMAQATTAFWQPLVTVSLANGAVVDFTLRIGAPQDESGSGTTSVILPAVGTPAATTRAFDVWSTSSLSWMKQVATTNLVFNSADFSAASWSKGTSITVTADSTTAPDGTVTADTLTPDVTSQAHQALSNTVAFVAGTFYTVSVYAKPNGYTILHMRFPSAAFGAANGRSAWFNLSSGAFNADVGTTATMTLTSNGFYRCSITMLCILSTSGTPVVGVNNSPGSGIQTFAGDGVSAIYAWGAQIESGPIATNYVPTTATAASRTSPGAFTFLMRALFYDAAINNPGSNFSSPLHLDDGTSNNQIDLTVSNGIMKFSTQVGGANQIFLSGGSTIPVGTSLIMGICADSSGASMCWGGGAVSTDISTIQMPTVNTLRIGRNNTANWPFYGEVRRLTYLPYRMSSAQLQAATT